MKKGILLIVSALFCTLAAQAQDSPKWLRQASISPDGSTVAFMYHGDIFTVPASGGEALRITSNPAHETTPVWSRDSRTLVFRSFREYSFDIWKVDARGGKPTRLTTSTTDEVPLCTTADGKVLYRANIETDASWGEFPGRPQIWSVSLDGGLSRRITPVPMMKASANAAGDILYEDYKGVEDPLRKHHTSSVTRDIWLCSNGKYTKLSTYKGENRNPVFAADGNTFWFVRENVADDPYAPESCFNVWRSSISNPSEQVQVTFFKTHPVRNLSAADDGTLLFSWNGELYTCREGSAPKKLQIIINSDFNEREVLYTSVSVIKNAAVSPDGKEIAVVSRGEVYVSSVEAKSTRRITNTPVQERGVSFSADGRTLYYASERDGEWGIWKSSLVNKEDKLFSLAYDFKEERVTDTGQTCFAPDVAPDGKWLAFIRNRSELVLKNTKSGAEKVLVNPLNYSYSDGDQPFLWSPDSKHMLVRSIEYGGWHNADVAMVDIETGETVNLTRSGFSDGSFNWALGGKAMTWESDKVGYSSHGSWGSQSDIYIMFFDRKAHHDFFQSKENDELDKLLKGDEKKKDKDKEKKDSTKAADKKKVDPIKLDLSSIEDRTARLTPFSGIMGDHYLTEDGTKLYFAMRCEKSTSLYVADLKEGGVKVAQKSFSGRFITSPDGKHVFVVSGLGVHKFEPKTGTTKSVSFSGEYEYRPAEERSYIFEHCWKQVAEKFYDTNIHGIQWQQIHDNYKSFLPYIDNNYDFQDLLSEMLGELNGSHTGARYRRLVLGAPSTAHIGVLFDENYSGKGLRIAEILPDSPLADAADDIAAGDIITAINGKEIPAGTAWWDAFAVRARGRMQITIDRKKGSDVTVMVSPESSDSERLYTRWVRQREEIVERLSGGKVGYVHVRKMDGDSFNEVYSRALGKYRGCEALIVDSRHNGGGWLHDDLVTFLGGKPYLEFRPRGRYISTDPFNKWTKPSCVLIGEDNYSDACGFPYAYRALGLGKLIGAPVPGTMTAVWWETQVDATLVFGIPQVTAWGLKEDRPLENFQIEPDILVYNDPESLLRGEDKQLEAAVAEMMKTIQK